ncbi:hypothetical protein [uncultured Bradyrhizobium sp.]|jgi:hypothetical protein|uniref:hypothetical protein n=1 Tax=uncultured Bradyrhizobium sp. TaxID=199684 RepID=UPI00261783C4|nr:hypothetical protein [uncultured Bradyrhizobium sp.]
MKAHSQNDTPEPSKALEAVAFLIVVIAGVAIFAIFDIRLGDVSIVASKLALVLALALAWIAKAVRITTTRVLLPFAMLFVVVQDEKIVGVQFWAVGALIAGFAALFVAG